MLRYLRLFSQHWKKKRVINLKNLSDKYIVNDLNELKIRINEKYNRKDFIEILFYFHFNHLGSYLLANQRNREIEEKKFSSVYNTSRSNIISEFSPIIDDLKSNGFIRIPHESFYIYIHKKKRKRKLNIFQRIILLIFFLYIFLNLLEIYIQKLIKSSTNLSKKSQAKPEKINLFRKYFVKKFHLTKSTSERITDFKGLDEVKEEIEEIISMIKYPLRYERSGANLIKGIILSGKPGTGKTMLARAIAGESKTNFIYVTASELQSPITGVTSLNIKELFSFASDHSPCIIFIDEIDSLLTREMRDR